MTCTCFIIPRDVLNKLAQDAQLSSNIRDAAAHTAQISSEIRKLRTHAAALTRVVSAVPAGAVGALAPAPAVTIYDCKHTQILPGSPVGNPGHSADATAARTFKETSLVADFYRTVFGRNSIDNGGMTMMSSIHYGTKFNNAMWNGTQMIYGDGDGEIFIDFTAANDVIAHELTHGVTEHSLQLEYHDDAGGLNESMSDCFGSMFRQWRAGQDVSSADWLIGSEIMGPAAKTKGYTCLRNMANPADSHALAPQPTMYSQLTPGMDPHYTSGPPNLAFYLACKHAGGKSWERVGQVWYRALTGSGSRPNLKMKDFANRTRDFASQLPSGSADVAAAVDAGWKHVGL